MSTVLFVCEGNRFRSQMAEGFFNAWAPPGWHGLSAGTDPKETVAPKAVELMQEVGIDISRQRPKPIDPEAAASAWKVIAMCSPDACPVDVAAKAEHWAVTDPADLPEKQLREIRDDIARRVRDLIREIERKRLSRAREQAASMESS